MRLISLYTVVFITHFCFAAIPTVVDVKATPISPWAVKIDYRVTGGDINKPLCLIASNTVTRQVCTVSENAIEGNLKWTEGRHSIRWNMMKDNVKWDRCNVVFAICVAKYCVIDLSDGANATSYPVTCFSDIPSGEWSPEHKTTKLVLRLIEAGTFKMNGMYDVTLSTPYFIGVYEVTQKQYKLVTGKSPYSTGDKLPVGKVSWNMIRGDSSVHNWPTKKTVDPDSFVGRLQVRTGLKFDLPTEVQWEYACRAGTTTTYSYGEIESGDYMWYLSNSSESLKAFEVGTKRHNAWGLYDMHGNVQEWCLDWYGSISGGIDPEGLSSGSGRVQRGGAWTQPANYCTSSIRFSRDPSYNSSNGVGFRLVRNLSK